MRNPVKLLVLLCAVAPAVSAIGQSTPGTNSRPSVKPSDLFTNSVVAKGKGVSVSRAQLDDALIGMKTTAAARGQNIPPQYMRVLERQVLDRLIHIQLLNNKATEADKAQGKELAEKRMAEIKSRAGSDEALEQQLKAVGFTPSELASKLTEEATAEAVLKRELKADVSEAEVKNFYEENPGRFEQPELARAAHILIATRDLATGAELSDEQKAAKRKEIEALLKRARSGEDFAKLAREHSEDPGSKDKGGEYTFPRGQMVPEFEAAAFSLNTNQVSDVITTPYGYHIIKLYEKIPAKKVEFAEVKDDIEEHLKTRAIQQQIPDYMDKLEEAANVEIVDETLKNVELPESMSAQPQPSAQP